MELERLTADDRLVRWTDEAWPQDVGVLAVLAGGPLLDAAGGFRLEVARDAIRARLHLFPRLRQVLCTPGRGLGLPLWLDDPSFDLDNHVREVRVPPPGGERELLDSVERLRRCRLDPSRPLWEMWFLPGVADGRVGWFIRLHHVVADGVAGIAGLAALMDTTRDAPPPTAPAWTPRPGPSARDLLVDNVRRRARAGAATLSAVTRPRRFVSGVRRSWPATREVLWGEPGPSTRLDGLIGRDRSLAVLRSSLSQVSGAAHAHEATVNDVLLAMVAGGVRSLLTSRGQPVEGLTVPVFVPVSLRRGDGAGGVGNRISQTVVRLPVGLADPHDRLRRITAATAQQKAMPHAPLGTTFGSRVLSRPMLRLVIRQRVNVTTTDLVGPSSARWFAGAPVLDLFPLLNLLGNITLGVGAMSYAGGFDLLACGDRRLHPDLDAFTEGARAELEDLAAPIMAAGVDPSH